MLIKRAASFWLHAMFYTMLQRVSLFAFGVLTYMLLVRGFPTAINGIWALYVTFSSLVELVKQGLIRNATIKFQGMTQYAGRAAAVHTASLLLNTVFSLAAIILILAAGKLLAEHLGAPQLFALLLWSPVVLLLLIPYNHCEIVLQGVFRFNTLFRAALLRQGIFFAGVCGLYFFAHRQFTLVNVLLMQVAALAAAVVYIWKASADCRPRELVFDGYVLKKVFQFGKYTFATNLLSGLSRSFDHFLTASVLGGAGASSYVAYYNTVARVNNMVDVPALAAADVLYPKNVEALEQKGLRQVKYYFEQVAGTILAFTVPLSLFVFVFSRWIVYILAGPDYHPAVILLQLTILFSVSRPLSYQFGSTLDAIGHPGVNFKVNFVLTVLNFFLTWVLLNHFGGIGAAYATIVYYCVSFSLMLMVLKKYLQVSPANVLRFGWGKYKMVYGVVKRRLR